MATAIQIPMSEYLDTTYHPDREYIDGELKERNVGKWEHSRLQLLLGGWFMIHELAWDITGGTEQRMQISPSRIRIPDLAFLRPGTQQEVLSLPPLLVIEILSPNDTYSDLQERCEDYLEMGVETIWIIDPKTRSGRMCLGTKWIGTDRLEVPGTPIHIELPVLLAQINATAGSQTKS